MICSVCCLQVARLHVLLKEGIASGEVQPLPWTVFARGKAEDAFRYLASGARLILKPSIPYYTTPCNTFSCSRWVLRNMSG